MLFFQLSGTLEIFHNKQTVGIETRFGWDFIPEATEEAEYYAGIFGMSQKRR